MVRAQALVPQSRNGIDLVPRKCISGADGGSRRPTWTGNSGCPGAAGRGGRRNPSLIPAYRCPAPSAVIWFTIQRFTIQRLPRQRSGPATEDHGDSRQDTGFPAVVVLERDLPPADLLTSRVPRAATIAGTCRGPWSQPDPFRQEHADVAPRGCDGHRHAGVQTGLNTAAPYSGRPSGAPLPTAGNDDLSLLTEDAGTGDPITNLSFPGQRIALATSPGWPASGTAAPVPGDHPLSGIAGLRTAQSGYRVMIAHRCLISGFRARAYLNGTQYLAGAGQECSTAATATGTEGTDDLDSARRSGAAIRPLLSAPRFSGT